MATNRTRAARKVDAARSVTDNLRAAYNTAAAVEPIVRPQRQVKVTVAKVRKSRSGQQR